MGNACCREQRDVLEIRSVEGRIPLRIGALTVAAVSESSGKFGQELNDFYIKPNRNVMAAITKHGLYKFEESGADLGGTESLPVKHAFNTEMVYLGQILGKKLHGKAHMLTKAGDLYVCPFVEGQAEGIGAIYFSNGDYYKGKIVAGDIDNGIMRYADGTSYRGEFLNRKRHGRGIYTYKDGRQFDGHWFNDVESGYGRLIIPGVWKDGCLQSAEEKTPEKPENPTSPNSIDILQSSEISQIPLKSAANLGTNSQVAEEGGKKLLANSLEKEFSEVFSG